MKPSGLQRIVMKFWLLLFALAALIQSATELLAAPGVAPTEALRPEEQRTMFHLPPGFEIQLVVSIPILASQ